MEQELPQRWLSLDGICTQLNISRSHAVWLAKSGFLEVIWGKPGRQIQEARFLDPTPAYAERLKVGEALYGRLFPIPHDLDLCGLLTLREVAEILCTTQKYAKKMLWERKVPKLKAGKYDLYSPAVVRELMWRRSGRKQAHQRAPFLIVEMIRYFLRSTSAAEEEVPSDAQFAQDDLLQRKLTRMMKLPSPQRELALNEFLEKMDLAKQVSSALRQCQTAGATAPDAAPAHP